MFGQVRKYQETYYIRSVDAKYQRKAGTVFQIMGATGMVISTFGVFQNSRAKEKKDFSVGIRKSVFIPSAVFFAVGTTIKICARKYRKPKTKQ